MGRITNIRGCRSQSGQALRVRWDAGSRQQKSYFTFVQS